MGVATAQQPRIENNVNVTVNVGAPAIVPGAAVQGRTAPGAIASNYTDEWYKNPVVVILALVFFWPVGLALMWKFAPWTDDTKWAVSGIFFWPLWARFAWKRGWSNALGVAVLILLAAAYVVLLTPARGVALFVGIPAFILALQSGDKERAPDISDSQRRDAEAKLAACDDLIGAIEGTIALSLLPDNSPIHSRYMHALEERKAGAETLERAVTDEDVTNAGQRLTGALRDLRGVSKELSQESSRPHS